MARIECPNCNETNDGSGKFCANCGHALPAQPAPEPVFATAAGKPGSTGSGSSPYAYPMPPKKNKTGKIILLVVGAMIVVWGGSYVFFQFVFIKKATHQLMELNAKNLNSQCPHMTDKLTRIDGARVLGDTAFEYLYTLNMDKSAVDKNLIITNLTSTLTEIVKNANELNFLKQEKITFIYTYRAKDGAFLFSIPIRADMYQ